MFDASAPPNVNGQVLKLDQMQNNFQLEELQVTVMTSLTTSTAQEEFRKMERDES
jgi:hypothetical protein